MIRKHCGLGCNCNFVKIKGHGMFMQRQVRVDAFHHFCSSLNFLGNHMSKVCHSLPLCCRLNFLLLQFDWFRPSVHLAFTDSTFVNSTFSPLPRSLQVRWTKTAGSASDKFQETSIYNETLRIEGIQRVQGGRYYCKADNGVGVAAIKSIRVDVQCKWAGRKRSTSRPQLTITAAIPTVREDRDGERWKDWRRKDERQIGWMMRFQVGMASRSIWWLVVERMKSMVGGLGGKRIDQIEVRYLERV